MHHHPMQKLRVTLFLAILGLAPLPCGAQAVADADRISLRLGGREIALSPVVHARIAGLAREIVAVCGPNSVRHPGNFGPQALGVEHRLGGLLQASRLHIVFAKTVQARSQLGGDMPVSEAVIGLEDEKLFVGPTITRHEGAVAEHLQCGYLASLELACLPELGPHLAAGYGATCRRLERGADGRIVMPPPDIAPSCS